MESVKRGNWKKNMVETEEWLHEVAQEGMQISKLDYNNGIFYFNKSYPCEKYYLIDFVNKNDIIQELIIKEAGYDIIYDSDRCIVAASDKKITSIGHRGIKCTAARKKGLSLAGIIISSILAVILLFVAAGLITESIVVSDKETSYVLVMYVMGFMIGMVTLLIVSIRKYYVNSCVANNMINEPYDSIRYKGEFYRDIKFDNKTKQSMLASKAMIRKKVLFPTRAAYRYEKINSEMVSKGYILYEVDQANLAMYYIQKPADYEYEDSILAFDITKEYASDYALHNIELGYKLAYFMVSCGKSYALWYKEYKAGEEKQDYYYDKKAIWADMLLNLICNIFIAILLGINLCSQAQKIDTTSMDSIVENGMLIGFVVLVAILYIFMIIYHAYILLTSFRKAR